ncbi:MAG: hypothetical protein ACYC1C_09365, partial [Chloroflexota bacterium]
KRRGTELAIERKDDEVFDVIRDAAADLGVAIRALRASTRTLEDVYIQQVAAKNGGEGNHVRSAG